MRPALPPRHRGLELAAAIILGIVLPYAILIIFPFL
jgi:hypothetical protein